MHASWSLLFGVWGLAKAQLASVFSAHPIDDRVGGMAAARFEVGAETDITGES
jgi:hypothetical protein